MKYARTEFEVREISENAFKGNTLITKITLPDTVTEIGQDAFRDAPDLSPSTCLASSG